MIILNIQLKFEKPEYWNVLIYWNTSTFTAFFLNLYFFASRWLLIFGHALSEQYWLIEEYPIIKSIDCLTIDILISSINKSIEFHRTIY